MNPDILVGAITLAVGYGLTLYFRDRDKQRQHESALSVEILATARDQSQNVLQLDEHVRTNLGNYKNAMVEVLKDMRELVKNTETERQRTAGVAAATLLRPGNAQRKMPQP